MSSEHYTVFKKIFTDIIIKLVYIFHRTTLLLEAKYPNTYFSKLPMSSHYSAPYSLGSLLYLWTPNTHFWDHRRFIPDWMEKASTISFCCWVNVIRELEVGAITGIEIALKVFLRMASLTNSSSFTMNILEEKWAIDNWWMDNPMPSTTILLQMTLGNRFLPFLAVPAHHHHRFLDR